VGEERREVEKRKRQGEKDERKPLQALRFWTRHTKWKLQQERRE
jgi:hypothetical protein